MERGLLERQYFSQGLRCIGLDEVGRGCIAGPVFASAVSLDFHKVQDLDENRRALIRDSKTLSSKQRQEQLETIGAIANEIAIGAACERDIERVGIQGAVFLAMKRALALCVGPYDLALVDGNREIPDLSIPQKTIIKGDNLCFCIAAASIVAKEARDDFMRLQAVTFPLYAFDQHVGYGTAQHVELIKTHGICSLHRRNFAPVNQYVQVGKPI